MPVVILDDNIPETIESFFIYLHSPLGGARVEDIHDDQPSGIMKIVILSNDSPNGRLGFASYQSECFYVLSIELDIQIIASHISSTQELKYSKTLILGLWMSWSSVSSLMETLQYFGKLFWIQMQMKATTIG